MPKGFVLYSTLSLLPVFSNLPRSTGRVSSLRKICVDIERMKIFEFSWNACNDYPEKEFTHFKAACSFFMIGTDPAPLFIRMFYPVHNFLFWTHTRFPQVLFPRRSGSLRISRTSTSSTTTWAVSTSKRYISNKTPAVFLGYIMF